MRVRHQEFAEIMLARAFGAIIRIPLFWQQGHTEVLRLG